MKLKNILLVFAAIIISLFTNAVKADTAPDTFTVTSSNSISTQYYLPGPNFDGGNVFIHKKTADDRYVYCTEIHKSSATDTYTKSEELDDRYVYVLKNGFANKSLFGSEDKDYLTTAIAIWYLDSPEDNVFKYFDFAAGTYNGNPSDVTVKVNELITGAQNYKNVEPSISVEASNTKLSLSSDGKYYVSEAIGVKTTGTIKNKTYSVSLTNAPEGTIVTDTNGNEKTEFSTDSKFIVKVPTTINSTSIAFGVAVSAVGDIYKAYLYKPSSTDYQSVAALYPESKDVNDNIELSLNINTEVQISKIDATTSEELPGAHLVVKDSTGKIVDEWDSTAEVHVITGLKPGTYTLTETIAPEGYILSEETIEFTIKADGSVTKVEMKNYPIHTIVISKQDITNGEELPGAHLVIKDANGEIIYAWISSDTPFIIEDQLAPGTYYLTETIAPEGYILSEETVEFIVKEDGTVDGIVIMYNKPETIDVPITSAFKTITASLIGIAIIGLGALIIYKNYKKNEEK